MSYFCRCMAEVYLWWTGDLKDMVVVVSATAVESQDTLHVTVPVVEAPVAVDIVAVVADQVSTRHCLIQFFI